MKRFITVAGLALATLATSVGPTVLSTAASAATKPPPMPATSANWSGWWNWAPDGRVNGQVVKGVVEASFITVTVPNLPYKGVGGTRNGPYEVSFAAGLGGQPGRSYEQAGVNVRYDNRWAKPKYRFFYQVIPANGSSNVVYLNGVTIKPGDKAFVSVYNSAFLTGTSQSKYQFHVWNQTTDKQQIVNVALPRGGTKDLTAEVVTEWPRNSSHPGFLTPGKVFIFGSYVYQNDSKPTGQGIAYGGHKIKMTHGRTTVDYPTDAWSPDPSPYDKGAFFTYSTGRW